MSARPVIRRVVPALALTAVLAAPAAAQRNGDVRNGRDYQPTTGEVQARERAAGVLPPPPVQEQKTGAVDAIYDTLMKQEKAAPPASR